MDKNKLEKLVRARFVKESSNVMAVVTLMVGLHREPEADLENVEQARALVEQALTQRIVVQTDTGFLRLAEASDLRLPLIQNDDGEYESDEDRDVRGQVDAALYKHGTDRAEAPDSLVEKLEADARKKP